MDNNINKVWEFYTDIKHLKIITPKEINLQVINTTDQRFSQGTEIWIEGKILISKRKTWHSVITFLKPYEYVEKCYLLIVPNPPGTEPTAKTVIIDNARAYNPTVIDSTGKNVTYLPPNTNYTMDGTESYINSGWLWPQGQVPPGAPLLTTFTVTFEKPGIYDYVCTVHPWMTGSVEVT